MATTTKTRPVVSPPAKTAPKPPPPVEQEAQAAMAEVEHILAGDPPPVFPGRLKCHRCGRRYANGGHTHQPGNGVAVQTLCPECAYLFQVCLRHTGHSTVAAVEICNVEGIGRLDV